MAQTLFVIGANKYSHSQQAPQSTATQMHLKLEIEFTHSLPYSMYWDNPSSILNSQFVFSVTSKMVDYHSNN